MNNKLLFLVLFTITWIVTLLTIDDANLRMLASLIYMGCMYAREND